MSSLGAILSRREARVELRRQLQQEHQLPLVVFTMNIPGPEKRNPLYASAHQAGEERLVNRLSSGNIHVLRRIVQYGACGRETFFIVRTDAELLKRICCEIEEDHPLGRLFDMDVYDENSFAVKRTDIEKGPRSCFLCNKPAGECARSRRHPIGEIQAFVENSILTYLESSEEKPDM